jgi:hypothetical protein
MLSCLGGLQNISATPVNNFEEFVRNYVTKEETRVDGPWSKGFAWLPAAPIRTIKRQDMYAWQREVVDIVEREPDDRKIHWFYEPDGNMGKTALAKWLVVHKGAFLFKGGSNDMANRIIANGAPKICVMNLARTQENYVSYQTLEDIKDGLVCSGKYEGGQLAFDSPHVLVFANFRPDETKLSLDRWDIVRLLPNGSSMDPREGMYSPLFKAPSQL